MTLASAHDLWFTGEETPGSTETSSYGRSTGSEEKLGGLMGQQLTYRDQSTVEFEQSKMLAHSSLLVELLQRESHRLLNLIVVCAGERGAVGADEVHFLPRNC